jgi:hypothetical protein
MYLHMRKFCAPLAAYRDDTTCLGAAVPLVLVAFRVSNKLKFHLIQAKSNHFS